MAMSNVLSLSVRRLFVIALCSISLTCSANDDGKKRVLISAKPTIAEFVRSSSTEHVIAPPMYKVTLTNIKVFEGDTYEFPEELVVELKTNSEKALLGYEEIFLVLELTEDSVKALYWEKVLPLVCLPKALVEEGYGDWYFDSPWNGDNQKCRFLKRYEPPESD